MASSLISSLVLLLLLFLFPLLSHAATFNITNKCSYTIWAAAVPGGGQQLSPSQSWTLTVPANTVGRIWARTNCTFNSNGQGSCQTGDCGGVLQCTTDGTPPNTLAEYALSQFNNLDIYDISLVDGFNVPIDFTPTTPSGSCRSTSCSADINGQCPAALQVPGGCQNPCTVFKTDDYCCTGAAASSCEPNVYSSVFKNLCPEAYISPAYDETNFNFQCPTGTDYQITFCP